MEQLLTLQVKPTISQLSAELAAGKTTSRRLVEEALARIGHALGEGSRAVVKVYDDEALAEADASDKLRASGVVRSLVEGLPVSVKDVFDIAGDVTRAGSKVLENASPAETDALSVARLRAAGAIIIGRTATMEFGFGALGVSANQGTPLNPFDRVSGGRVPGGDPGSAVAVADAMCVMGLGSEARGAVRISAALCGLVGFKPTADRVPREGVFELSASLDSVGLVCNSVACCAVWDAILSGDAGADSLLQGPPLSQLRFAVPVDLLQNLEPQIQFSFERAIQMLMAGGAVVEKVESPFFSRAVNFSRQHDIGVAESFELYRDLMAQNKDEIDPFVETGINRKGGVSSRDYIKQLKTRAALIKEAVFVCPGYDAMICPTVAVVAPSIADVSKSDEAYLHWNAQMSRNTGLVNILDGCGVTIPCNFPGEPPVGLSVFGLQNTDRHVLSAAISVEETIGTSWHLCDLCGLWHRSRVCEGLLSGVQSSVSKREALEKRVEEMLLEIDKLEKENTELKARL